MAGVLGDNDYTQLMHPFTPQRPACMPHQLTHTCTQRMCHMTHFRHTLLTVKHTTVPSLGTRLRDTAPRQ